VGSAVGDTVVVWEREAPVDPVALAAAVWLAVADTLAVLAAECVSVPDIDGVAAALCVAVAVAVPEAGDAEMEGDGVGEGMTSASDLRTWKLMPEPHDLHCTTIAQTCTGPVPCAGATQSTAARVLSTVPSTCVTPPQLACRRDSASAGAMEPTLAFAKFVGSVAPEKNPHTQPRNSCKPHNTREDIA